MQKIIPFLWFNTKAEKAARFYTSLFKNSKTINATHYDKDAAKVSGQREGSVMTISFQLADQDFVALNGGSAFSFSPATSFFVNTENEQEINELWKKLSDNGTVLMELGAYPFSEKYGWVQDEYGLSWQLNLGSRKQKITPFLLFVGLQHGNAGNAIRFYTSLFPHSKINTIIRYGTNDSEEMEGTVKHALFTLNGQEFMAIDSAREHAFTFTPALSFVVNCKTQEEVDKLWGQLSADPASEQCGWLKDKYGVSWQIVPNILEKLLADPDPAKAQRVMRAMLQMKKLEIDKLIRAYENDV